LQSSPNIIRVIRMRHVAQMRDDTCIQIFQRTLQEETTSKIYA